MHCVAVSITKKLAKSDEAGSRGIHRWLMQWQYQTLWRCRLGRLSGR